MIVQGRNYIKSLGLDVGNPCI